MQRSRTSGERRGVRRLWEAFVSGEEPNLDLLPKAIRASWKRSRNYGIDPRLDRAPFDAEQADGDELRRATPWLGAAEPAFAMLRSVLSEPHQLIMLADDAGRVLLAHAGEKARARAEDLNVLVGSNWSEAQVGCTALGACLHDGVAVLADWGESYSCNWHDWVNQAVPIRDPATGAIVGGINVAGFRELVDPRASDLTARAAALMEHALAQRDWRARAEVYARFNALLRSSARDGIIAVDRHGRLMAFNEAAGRRFSLSSADVGEPLGAISPLADLEGPDKTASSRNVRSFVGLDFFEVGADGYCGGIYIAPSAVRASRAPSWPARYKFDDLVGGSATFKACLVHARAAAGEKWPVLLRGESGTGKELLAHAIHSAGPRRYGPFVGFSCAGVNDDLVAAELFGYSPGSFTGATKDGRIGKVEVADRGTLFLDDVDCMPARMQASLLRVIEDQLVLPVGATAPRKVDVRIIAATNADLERACAQGGFRYDLLHRLDVITIAIPPLRERGDDLRELVPHLLRQLHISKPITDAALDRLMQRAWPGNVRELRNALIRAAMHSTGPFIDVADVCSAAGVERAAATAVSARTLSPAAQAELDALQDALANSRSVQQAAERLGIHFTSVYRRMRKYGMRPKF